MFELNLCMQRKMVLKTMKSPYSLILLLVMVILFLLLHNSCNSTTTGTLKTRQLNAQSADSRNKELIQMFRKTTMQDRTVILTVVGQEWARPDSVLDLFLESFRIGAGTKPLLNHLVIFALDSNAFQYCKSIHPHCLYLSDSTRKYATNNPLFPPHLKYKLLEEVIELGYNIAFTDADVMWLRNPLLGISISKELTVACDFNGDDPSRVSSKVDGGFFFMKANGVTVEYVKYWNMERYLFPNSQNRSLCEDIVLNEDIIQMIDLRINFLDLDLFGRFCQQNVNMDRICTIRANCCDDIENKVHDLKLLLEDWRKKKLPTSRAPSKCKG